MNARRPMSKVNQLREINNRLTKEANTWQDMANNIIMWVHTNCTEEQKKDFSDFLKDHCKRS